MYDARSCGPPVCLISICLNARTRRTVRRWVLWSTPRRFSNRFPKAVEGFRILHQDAVARRLVGDPLGQEIEQDRVVRMLVALGGMRPVARPYHALGRRLH